MYRKREYKNRIVCAYACLWWIIRQIEKRDVEDSNWREVKAKLKGKVRHYYLYLYLYFYYFKENFLIGFMSLNYKGCDLSHQTKVFWAILSVIMHLSTKWPNYPFIFSLVFIWCLSVCVSVNHSIIINLYVILLFQV